MYQATLVQSMHKRQCHRLYYVDYRLRIQVYLTGEISSVITLNFCTKYGKDCGHKPRYLQPQKCHRPQDFKLFVTKLLIILYGKHKEHIELQSVFLDIYKNIFAPRIAGMERQRKT